MNGTTLVSHNEGGLIGVETHAGHRGIHLEQSLALLGSTPERSEKIILLIVIVDDQVLIQWVFSSTLYVHVTCKTTVFTSHQQQ